MDETGPSGPEDPEEGAGIAGGEITSPLLGTVGGSLKQGEEAGQRF